MNEIINRKISIDQFADSSQLSFIEREFDLSEFSSYEMDGHIYHGAAPWPKKVEVEICHLISSVFSASPDIKMSYFRSETKDHVPTSWIHADACIAAFAMVLYLSDPPPGEIAGTAFWSHKIVGDRLDESVSRDVIPFLQRDAAFQDCWDLEGVIKAKKGRAVFYETSIFHSRYPRQSWGDSVSDGRKTAVAFFDL